MFPRVSFISEILNKIIQTSQPLLSSNELLNPHVHIVWLFAHIRHYVLGSNTFGVPETGRCAQLQKATLEHVFAERSTAAVVNGTCMKAAITSGWKVEISWSFPSMSRTFRSLNWRITEILGSTVFLHTTAAIWGSDDRRQADRSADIGVRLRIACTVPLKAL